MYRLWAWILSRIRAALMCIPRTQQEQQEIADVDPAKLQARFDGISRKSLDEFKEALRRQQKKID